MIVVNECPVLFYALGRQSISQFTKWYITWQSGVGTVDNGCEISPGGNFCSYFGEGRIRLIRLMSLTKQNVWPQARCEVWLGLVLLTEALLRPAWGAIWWFLFMCLGPGTVLYDQRLEGAQQTTSLAKAWSNESSRPGAKVKPWAFNVSRISETASRWRTAIRAVCRAAGGERVDSNKLALIGSFLSLPSWDETLA